MVDTGDAEMAEADSCDVGNAKEASMAKASIAAEEHEGQIISSGNNSEESKLSSIHEFASDYDFYAEQGKEQPVIGINFINQFVNEFDFATDEGDGEPSTRDKHPQESIVAGTALENPDRFHSNSTQKSDEDCDLYTEETEQTPSLEFDEDDDLFTEETEQTFSLENNPGEFEDVAYTLGQLKLRPDTDINPMSLYRQIREQFIRALLETSIQSFSEAWFMWVATEATWREAQREVLEADRREYPWDCPPIHIDGGEVTWFEDCVKKRRKEQRLSLWHKKQLGIPIIEEQGHMLMEVPGMTPRELREVIWDAMFPGEAKHDNQAFELILPTNFVGISVVIKDLKKLRECLAPTIGVWMVDRRRPNEQRVKALVFGYEKNVPDTGLNRCTLASAYSIALNWAQQTIVNRTGLAPSEAFLKTESPSMIWLNPQWLNGENTLEHMTGWLAQMMTLKELERVQCEELLALGPWRSKFEIAVLHIAKWLDKNKTTSTAEDRYFGWEEENHFSQMIGKIRVQPIKIVLTQGKRKREAEKDEDAPAAKRDKRAEGVEEVQSVAMKEECQNVNKRWGELEKSTEGFRTRADALKKELREVKEALQREWKEDSEEWPSE
ncbi:hypothetical protein C8035_v007317 [Colletotrichum spinosum]|uniref:Uncharacterized protein n=1 Tax=Colletotrichum spinosum TaxID=1347390 RepID=A0A4R8QS51_9PEZI|nr:hypothetical protein C8035_v007317 [Colletotrichum spinosum]